MNKEMHEDGDDDHIEQQFIERFNDLRRFDKYSDCSFKLEGNVVNCHKLILTAASPVFEAMFYGPLAETRVVKVDDIGYTTFGKMLDFIYTGKIDHQTLSVREHLELFYCAQKYIIEGLGKAILKSLIDSTRKNNVLGILKMSYEMSLDDITYSCIYAIKQWMEGEHNFGNHILQKTNHQLPPKLVSFLVHEIFDFKNYNSILCFVRAWCLVECSLRGLEPNRDNFRHILLDCDLPQAVNEILLYQDYAFANSVKHTALLQRTYHKAVRPLVIGNDMEASATFWSEQFVTIAAFSINSRLIPSNQKVELHSTYTEEVFLELRASESQALIYSKQHVIHNVEYNESAQISLPTPVILFPGVQYTMKLKWDSDWIDSEYPRSVFSNFAKQKGICVNFLEDGIFLQGSILNGLICEV